MKGLCFSGGGIKAAAHIGALKAIEEDGLKFDCVSGASSGSIVALLYALGYSSDEMLFILKKYSKKIKYIEPKKIIQTIFGLLFSGKFIIDGLNSGNVIEKIVKEVCLEHNVTNISQIDMPLLISMVELINGTVYIASSKELRKTFSDDTIFITDIPVAKAVRASCSYPGVISPCLYNHKQFVDGGIRENLPWKELKQIGADTVLGINFETVLCNEDYFDNMIDIATRSLDLVSRELSIYEFMGIDYLITIPFPKVSLLDSTKIDILYEAGYISAKKQLTSTPLA